MDTNSQEKSKKIQTLWKIVKPLLIVSVLSGAFFLLYRQLKYYHYHDLANQLKTYSRWTIALALAITACNYFILTFYDVIGADISALIRKGKPLSPAKDKVERKA